MNINIPALTDWLEEKILDLEQELKDACNDQNTRYFGVLMGEHNAFKQVCDYLKGEAE